MDNGDLPIRAAGEVLAASDAIQDELRARIAENLASLDGVLKGLGPDTPLRRLASDGGWSALMEVPRTRSDEAWVEYTLRETDVLVHPGFFFDMAEGTMVVSLLVESDTFRSAIRRVVEAGAVGINIEDGTGEADRPLLERQVLVAWYRAGR